MRILKCHFSNGSVAAVLIHSETSCPVFLPLVHTVLFLQGKSYQTSYKTALSIKLLYEFFASIGVNFEEQAISGQFQPIFKNLDSLIHRLRTNPQNTSPVSYQEFDFYLRSFKSFLKWLVTRYNKDPNPYFITVIEERFTSSLLHLPSPPSEFKSLDDLTVQHLESIILPTSHKNPFRPRTRLRNWLMVELLLHTGMRSGELLNLKVPDIYKDGDSYYVRIRRSTIQEVQVDPRYKKPSIKNLYSIRVVAISQLLFMGFEKYLAAGRKKKASKINHGYLFTSERERPMASNSLSAIFSRIQDRLQVEYPDAVTVTPHALRHTFAEKMLRFLLEVKEIDMDRAKDELRNICGWSATSPMPNLYARRYIALMANAHNLERINSSFNN